MTKMHLWSTVVTETPTTENGLMCQGENFNKEYINNFTKLLRIQNEDIFVSYFYNLL